VLLLPGTGCDASLQLRLVEASKLKSLLSCPRSCLLQLTVLHSIQRGRGGRKNGDLGLQRFAEDHLLIVLSGYAEQRRFTCHRCHARGYVNIAIKWVRPSAGYGGELIPAKSSRSAVRTLRALVIR